MTQSDLNRGVAHSTGETISEISRRGFIPVEDLDRECDPPIDWDELEARRNVNIFPWRKRPAIAS
jgi:hypothetical protein